MVHYVRIAADYPLWISCRNLFVPLLRCIRPPEHANPQDLVHRGTARLVDALTQETPFRPLFKFLYNRGVAPLSPSWDHSGCSTPSFEEKLPPSMRPVAQSMWEWLAGSVPPAESSHVNSTAAVLAQSMQRLYCVGESVEDERIGCVYSLGRRAWHGDKQALDCLLKALATADPNARRASIYGLQAAGDIAVPGLLRALGAADRPQAIAQAAEALGEACRKPTLQVAKALADAMARLRSDEKFADYSQIVMRDALAFCIDALKYVAQRAQGQFQCTSHGANDSTLAEIASTVLDALKGDRGDDDVVRECRGKALVVLSVLPKSIWPDDGESLATGLAELSEDPSQYALAMGSTGLARMARSAGGPVARARQAVLARQAELRYIALDNTSLH